MSLKINGGNNSIDDYTNAGEILKFAGNASPVNEITVGNAATGAKPYLIPSGESNIGAELRPNGTGGWAFGSGGAGILKTLKGTATWDPGSLADGASASTTVTVTGATTGMIAFAGLTTIGANAVIISAHVSAADTVTVVIENRSGGVLDIVSGTLTVFVWSV